MIGVVESIRAVIRECPPSRGHVISEQPGMEDLAKWLLTFVKGIPIQFAPAEEPFWT